MYSRCTVVGIEDLQTKREERVIAHVSRSPSCQSLAVTVSV